MNCGTITTQCGTVGNCIKFECALGNVRLTCSQCAHVIKYARDGAVELHGRSFSRYFFKLGSIKKKKKCFI